MSIDIKLDVYSTHEEHVALLRKRVAATKVTMATGTDEEHNQACYAVERICSVNIVEYMLQQIDEKDRLLGAVGQHLSLLSNAIERHTDLPLRHYEADLEKEGLA